MDPLVLDALVVLLLVVTAVAGWRSGLVLSASATIGFLLGAVVGMWALPPLLDHVGALHGNVPLRIGTLSLGVLLLGSVGQVALSVLGSMLRDRVRLRPVQLVDALAGAVAALVVVAGLVWFAGDALRVAAPGALARTVAASRVLRTIDEVMPPAASRAFTGFRQQLEATEFPRVFDGIAAEPIASAEPPDPRVVQTPGVAAAARSIVQVVGDAADCRREQDGSGWVPAPERVVTNAHVVAGTDRVRVRIGGTGRRYLATVVAFDPKLDLAVLAVPGLPAPPLSTAPALPARQSVVVAGFPGGGPYRLGAGRVRSVMAASGSDIYGRSGVVRQVYSVYAAVRPGNSGGPLLTTDGAVAGTVFATSVDDPSTGYALTTSATRAVIAAAVTAHKPVDTGACTTR
ncbi:MarP family serine protease [Arsenicicoccus dermatophilus]|uniref:MarP family serine protease n=1 Tax=Arsenicicoccus dermatophilus TaxID=1076331 RepID=UPI0039170CBD